MFGCISKKRRNPVRELLFREKCCQYLKHWCYCNEKTAQTQPGQTKQNQNVLLNYMQRLKPQNLMHKWQKLTKAQRQLTPKQQSLSDKSNSSQSEASEVGLKQQSLWISQRAFWSLWQPSLCGHDAKADANKNTCTVAAKSETKRSVVKMKFISVQRQETKWLSYAWEDHVLNSNLCIKSVIPLIFTEI